MPHEGRTGERVRQALVSTDRQRAAAVELIDNVVGRRGRDSLLPLFGPPAEALQAAHSRRRPETSSTVNPLQYLARSPDDWIRSCVLFDIGWRRLPGCEEVVEAGLSDPDARVRETALFALHRLSTAQRLGQRLQAMLSGGASDHAIPQGESPMALSLLEKVFFLKSVSLFEHIPGEEIVGIVPFLREVEIEPGVTFIRKGEEGDCLYIIVEGEVIASMEGGIERVSSSREVIGELAVLAEQPRSADCSARTRVVALRIDKAAFWRLLNAQPQITIEVMKVVVGRYLPGTAA